MEAQASNDSCSHKSSVSKRERERERELIRAATSGLSSSYTGGGGIETESQPREDRLRYGVSR